MKVSLITVCYNSGKTIESTIKSVLAQSHKNIEYIVCDGNSTDNTLEILNKYKDSIVVRSEPDKGIYDAMNKGIAVATGDIVGIINSDDFYAHKDVIANVVESFEETNVDSVYGDLQYVDPTDEKKIIRYWRSGNFKRSKMLRGWMIPHPTFFIKKDVYDKYGLFNWQYKISGDYEMILRLLYKHGISTTYLPEVMVKMRAGGVSNLSVFSRLRAQLEDHKAWKDNNLKRKYYTVPLKPVRKIGQFVYPKFAAFL